MIYALMMGRSGSVGFPKKNLKKAGFMKNCIQQEMLNQVLIGV